MTLQKAHELLAVQASMGGGYNRNAARLILAEIQADHGQAIASELMPGMSPEGDRARRPADSRG